jgi:hypothetical protein
MFDILATIPGKKRHTHSGWYSFNGVCCHHRGHSVDKRGRGGIKIIDGTKWSYHCFNCQFKCNFQLGRHFSGNLKQLLIWSGMDIDDINRYSFESFSQKELIEGPNFQYNNDVIEFENRRLPEYSVSIFDSDQVDVHVSYLHSRGLDPHAYPYYTVDDESRPRIIIPYFYNGRIVGNTSRFYDGRKPKYLSEQQTGYVFNIDNQKREWSSCILVEGQFDALSIDGCAYMSSNISDEQAKLLGKLRRNIIVVPDHDKTGMSICDRALNLGYQVSIPDWSNDIKDVNDAVKKYGKLGTLVSILESATSSRIKIEMARKKYK